jgi:2,5-diamino-6-(ribosylamino)-4(3H)-pyrimidinone 5'-phosphate reductase
MAMSLDGKITTYRRERIAMGTEHDRRLMDELRSNVDAVIVGAGTVKYDGYPVLLRYKDLEAKRTARGRPPHPINVALSRELAIPSTRPFFTHAGTQKIIFTTRAAPVTRVKRFSKLAEVIVLPKRTLLPSDVLNNLHQRKVESVLLEGGGEVHFAFAKEGVVDDVYITITPRLVGGATAPTVLDGKGFLASNHPHLRLVSMKRIGDELFLKYRVIRE